MQSKPSQFDARQLVAFVAVTLVANAIQADDPQPSSAQELRSTVDKLVGQLDADQRQVRNVAKAALLKLGPAILPHLPATELLPNEQVRNVIRGIRRELERRKAREAANASRVSLQGPHSLADALKSISEQTGNKIDSSQLATETLAKSRDFKLVNAPFWVALNEVCESASAEIASNASDGIKTQSSPSVQLVAVGAEVHMPTHADLQHAIRVQVAGVSLRPLFGDAKHHKLRVGLEFHAEPRLRPLFLKYGGADISASVGTDPSAQVLLPLANGDDSLELPLGENGRRIAIHADFRVPIALNVESANTHGELTMQCAAATERIRISNIAVSRGASRRRGGVTLLARRVDVVERDEKLDLSVQCVLTYDTGGPAFESHRTWVFHNRVFLQSQKLPNSPQESIEPTSFAIDGQANGGVMVTYQFRGLPPHFRRAAFEYHAPTLIVDIPVRFRFQGIRVKSAAK